MCSQVYHLCNSCLHHNHHQQPLSEISHNHHMWKKLFVVHLSPCTVTSSTAPHLAIMKKNYVIEKVKKEEV